MSRLKRAAIGTGITLLVLGVTIPLWYQSHYVVPPPEKLRVILPSPNGYDTLGEALKLEVTELAGIYVNLRPLPDDSRRFPPQPLEGRLKLVAAN